MPSSSWTRSSTSCIRSRSVETIDTRAPGGARRTRQAIRSSASTPGASRIGMRERCDDLARERELQRQILGLRFAAGLVLGIDLVAERLPARVEHDRAVVRILLAQRLQQHVGEDEHGLGRRAVGGAQIGHRREERAVDRVGAVDEDDARGGFRHARKLAVRGTRWGAPAPEVRVAGPMGESAARPRSPLLSDPGASPQVRLAAISLVDARRRGTRGIEPRHRGQVRDFIGPGFDLARPESSRAPGPRPPAGGARGGALERIRWTAGLT